MTFASSLRKILCVSPDNTPLRVVTGSIVDDNNCRRNSQMTERNKTFKQNQCVKRSREGQETVYPKKHMVDRMIKTTIKEKHEEDGHQDVLK